VAEVTRAAGGGGGDKAAEGRATVALEGMEFHAYHGVHDYELEKGARFVVDLCLEVPAPARDALAETVDYSRVFGTVADVVTGRRYKLIESLAAAVLEAVMATEPRVLAARVRVHKPHAPLPGVVRDVYCELERVREA